MSTMDQSGTFALGEHSVVKRLGYGAMQLAGPGVFGPPKDRDAALAVLRAAVAQGVNHIDTATGYGRPGANELIRTALHPYPDDLVVVTKIASAARRGWIIKARHSPQKSSFRRSTTICAISDWMRSTS